LTISVQEALAEGAAHLHVAGVESARLDARVLLATAREVSPDEVFAGPELRPEEHGRFCALVARRAAREPLAYITGHREFWSLSFAVGPGALIPRPETETLVEAALRHFGHDAALRVLDIGVGSGCLLITFLGERPRASGIGVDVSDVALGWAGRNAHVHGVSARCRLETASREPAGAESFDVILVNPPYLTAAEFEESAPEIRNWEPRLALVAGADGLHVIRALGAVLSRRLTREGKAFLEVGIGQATAAAEILARSGVDVREVIPDLSGIPRCLVAGRAGSGGR
jgi:release factor glutamine methyltransferase